MKKILTALLLLPAIALGAANDLLMSQRNGADTGTLSRTVSIPASGQNGLLGFNGSTALPIFYTIGPGLVLSGGVIDAAAQAPSWTSITGKPTFSTVSTSGSYLDLLNRPSTFAPSAHTHAAADIVSGILDAARIPALSISQTTGLQAALDAKFANPTGATFQYLRGDGSPSLFPTQISSFANDLGYLTSVSSGMVTSALGFTPYNSANPSGYVSQSGARSAISLTTTGSSGAATYNSGTGILNIPAYANSGGTVTSVTAGAGLIGGTITTSGTIGLPNTGTPGTYNTVTTDAQGRVTAGLSISINDSPARSLVTSTSATGFQVSATRVSEVCYEGSISTTSTIGGPSSATVFLETADTNSTTPTDWTIKAQQTYSNTITLAVVLNQVQANNWAFCRYIPAGKYVRIRSGSITGTASVSINGTQQEVLR